MGSSMQPALNSGQVVMLDRDYYGSHLLQRGDVVVFRWNDETYVKRVYALAGETVILACVEDSSWPIAPDEFARYGESFKKIPGFHVRTRTVPPGHFYSLGDNLNASLDSRELGAIPLDAVLGRVRL
jgi:signal peptidase I